MSEFRFSLSSVETRREGVIESNSFGEAVSSLGQHVNVQAGDVLEIGVLGFPPAHFECVGEMTKGHPVWMPAGRLAA